MRHHRTERVADEIQRELAQLLLQHTHDPRFATVTITSVDVSKDLANARIYVTTLDESKIKEILPALNHAAGYLRHLLAQSMNMRITPKLYFVYDESISRADKVAALLNKALRDDEKKDPSEE